MSNENTFSYTYSAKENQEVLNIRKKYLPQEESKLEELKRLDNTVQTSGVTESLCVGIVSALVFGVGLCFGMQVLGSGTFFGMLGVLIGLVGIGGMLLAYPVYRRIFRKTKAKLTPRILELTAELSGKTV